MSSEKPVLLDVGRNHGPELWNLLKQQTEFRYVLVDTKTDGFAYPPESELEDRKLAELSTAGTEFRMKEINVDRDQTFTSGFGQFDTMNDGS